MYDALNKEESVGGEISVAFGSLPSSERQHFLHVVTTLNVESDMNQGKNKFACRWAVSHTEKVDF